MAKSTRGKGVSKVLSKGRGTCPMCLSTRIKILYTANSSTGNKIKVCKKCKGGSVERIDRAVDTTTLAFRRKHSHQFHELKGSLVSNR